MRLNYTLCCGGCAGRFEYIHIHSFRKCHLEVLSDNNCIWVATGIVIIIIYEMFYSKALIVLMVAMLLTLNGARYLLASTDFQLLAEDNVSERTIVQKPQSIELLHVAID